MNSFESDETEQEDKVMDINFNLDLLRRMGKSGLIKK